MLLISLACGLLPGAAVEAASVLKVNAIEGEASLAGYEGWSYLSAHQQGVTVSSRETPAVSALRIVKPVDKASPELFRSLVTGERHNEAIVDFLTPTAPAARYFRIRLEDVIVTGQTIQQHEAGGPLLETVSFHFREIQFEALHLDTDGQTVLGGATAFYNLDTGEAGGGSIPGENAPPTLSPIEDVTTSVDTSVDVFFTVDDDQTPANDLVLSAASDNPSLLPVGNILFGGSGTDRSAELTPEPGQTGSATVTVIVSDGELETSRSFLLTVIADEDNQPPVLTLPGAIRTIPDYPTEVALLRVNDPDAGDGVLSLTLTVSEGILSLNTGIAGGVSAGQVTGNPGPELVVEALQTEINATLAAADGLIYRTAPGFIGDDLLSIHVNDNGHSGAGGPLSASGDVPIAVYAERIEIWREDHFSAGELADATLEATIWGDLADPSGHGVVNLLKYSFGMSPGEWNPAKLPQSEWSADGKRLIGLSHLRRTDDPSLSYSPEISTDLLNWSSGSEHFIEESVTPVAPDLERVRWLLSETHPEGDEARRFVRLRVTRLE